MGLQKRRLQHSFLLILSSSFLFSFCKSGIPECHQPQPTHPPSFLTSMVLPLIYMSGDKEWSSFDQGQVIKQLSKAHTMLIFFFLPSFDLYLTFLPRGHTSQLLAANFPWILPSQRIFSSDFHNMTRLLLMMLSPKEERKSRYVYICYILIHPVMAILWVDCKVI